MRTVYAALAAMSLCIGGTLRAETPPPANAALAEPESARIGEARTIIETMIPPDKRMEVYGVIVRNLLDQMRTNATREVSDAGLARIVNEHLDAVPARLQPIIEKHVPFMLEAQARAYARSFSLDELKQIRAFAETPAGRHYLTEAPKLIGDPDVASANRAYLGDVMAESRVFSGELTERVRAYLAKHPEATPRSRPAPQGR